MATTINAITSAGGGVALTGDSSGVLGFQSAGTTYMTMDTSGNLGIGWSGSLNTSSRLRVLVPSTYNYQVAEFYAQGASYKANVNIANDNGLATIGSNNDSLVFSTTTAQTERMRIDSSGNVLVGAAAKPTANFYGQYIKAGTSASSDWGFWIDNSSSTTIMRIRNDGVVYLPTTYSLTTATAANVNIDSQGILYRSTSSIKYKTDVQDAVHGLSDVMKLRSVTYKGINDGDTVFGGLIAEEVHEAGLTEFVQYAEDGTPDALAYGQMVSLAFKAIQEQQAIIEQLKADVEALKGAK